jgi:hypothetical protein
MSKSNKDPLWPRGFDEHREQQIIRIARESTPAQRLEWVEEMLELMALTGEPYLERKRRLRGG